MKIIRPSTSSKKSEVSTHIKSKQSDFNYSDDNASTHKSNNSLKSSRSTDLTSSAEAEPSSKPASESASKKTRFNRTGTKKKTRKAYRGNQKSRDSFNVYDSLASGNEPSLENENAKEESFDFDTSRLEAMPKDDPVEPMLIEGKKRRRSELQAEGQSEVLSLSLDPEKKEFNELFARGLRLLAMREHSVKEITTKLFDKSENADAIHAVIDDLLERKYLSDERFTESYIRSRSNKGFGPVKIKSELKNKGVSNALIQDHLNESAAIWFDNAEAQHAKKYGGMAIEDYNAWTKRARFLQGRGFTMEQIHCVIQPPREY